MSTQNAQLHRVKTLGGPGWQEQTPKYHKFVFAEHFAGELQLISAEPQITLGVLTQSAYLKERLELQPNILETWTAPDRDSSNSPAKYSTDQLEVNSV